MAGIVYDEGLFNASGSPSVPFDPKKFYYIAFYNDLSHVLLYGFTEDINDPFFSSQESCESLSSESMCIKRARYFDTGGGDITEVFLVPYPPIEAHSHPHVLAIMVSFDKMRLSPKIPQCYMRALSGHDAFDFRGSVAVIGQRKIQCGPHNMLL